MLGGTCSLNNEQQRHLESPYGQSGGDIAAHLILEGLAQGFGTGQGLRCRQNGQHIIASGVNQRAVMCFHHYLHAVGKVLELATEVVVKNFTLACFAKKSCECSPLNDASQ